MTKCSPTYFRVPNFKGKQGVHNYSCGCCWCFNDRRQKLDKIRNRDMEDELIGDQSRLESDESR